MIDYAMLETLTHGCLIQHVTLKPTIGPSLEFQRVLGRFETNHAEKKARTIILRMFGLIIFDVFPEVTNKFKLAPHN